MVVRRGVDGGGPSWVALVVDSRGSCWVVVDVGGSLRIVYMVLVGGSGCWIMGRVVDSCVSL